MRQGVCVSAKLTGCYCVGAFISDMQNMQLTRAKFSAVELLSYSGSTLKINQPWTSNTISKCDSHVGKLDNHLVIKTGFKK